MPPVRVPSKKRSQDGITTARHDFLQATQLPKILLACSRMNIRVLKSTSSVLGFVPSSQAHLRLERGSMQVLRLLRLLGPRSPHYHNFAKKQETNISVPNCSQWTHLVKLELATQTVRSSSAHGYLNSTCVLCFKDLSLASDCGPQAKPHIDLVTLSPMTAFANPSGPKNDTQAFGSKLGSCATRRGFREAEHPVRSSYTPAVAPAKTREP